MADDDDTFVTIGTPFDVPEENAPKKKALPLHEQFATDNEGRRRFHGAFAGGFSAGYFNTVGSKEGWKPSSFVSSRQRRFETSLQKPEDFMDEEDLGEFGIAPRNIETTKLFSCEGEQSNKRHKPAWHGASLDSSVSFALEDLVVPCRMTIGVKLLKKMGWKEGQGIGPRVRHSSKKKVYGCLLPPGQQRNEVEDDEHDVYAEGLLFAPKDTTPIKFVPKDNMHGIGYKGINLSAPMEIPKPGYSGSLKIKGQAFGVGAFEEDDEDVYAQDSMSNYDIELNDRKSTKWHFHGWTGPPTQSEKGGALSNFSPASRPRPANKVFPPPSIPRGYQPFLSVKESNERKPNQAETQKHSSLHLTSSERGKLLGEEPLPKPIKSVFEYMSKSDKDRLEFMNSSRVARSSVGKTTISTEPLLSQKVSFIGPSGFQPFAKDPAKQARYESFLESRESGKVANLPKELCGGLTEWEREREKEEFARSAMLFQPLKGSMAARFTRGDNIDDNLDNNRHESSYGDGDSPQTKAAKMKMFGKLTRNTYEWHPAKLLCKRFNIAEPYPSSTTVGLIQEKKEKFSLGHLFKSSKEGTEEHLAKTNNLTTVSNEQSSSLLPALPEPKHENTPGNPNSFKDILERSSSDATVLPLSSKEKPSMDLFKAIFASSSEDESEESPSENDDEDTKNKEGTLSSTSVTSSADVSLQSNQQAFVDKNVSTDVRKSENVLVNSCEVKMIEVGNSRHENTMEVDESEYGPRPPPKKTDNFHKPEFKPRLTVPFSALESETESEHSQSKHKKKHKRKHKHKGKGKEKEKIGESQSRSHAQKLQNRDTKQLEKIKRSELPDDKAILSRLKAVQSRRMRAADFM